MEWAQFILLCIFLFVLFLLNHSETHGLAKDISCENSFKILEVRELIKELMEQNKEFYSKVSEFINKEEK